MPHRGDDFIDPATLLATLGNFPDASFSPLTGGIDARMWRVDSGQRQFALRLLTPSQTGQMQREIASASWARQHGFPVPGVIANATWKDHPVALIEWADGNQLAQEILGDADPVSAAANLGAQFGRLQATLHALPLPTDQIIAERDWRTWAPASEELASNLAKFSPTENRLLHLDYHR